MNDAKRIGGPSSYMRDLTRWGMTAQEFRDAIGSITSAYRTTAQQITLFVRTLYQYAGCVWPEVVALSTLRWPQRGPLPAYPFDWARDVPRDDLALRKFPPLVGRGRGSVLHG